LEEKCSADFYY